MAEARKKKIAGDAVVIPISATQQSGTWVVTDPGTTEVFAGEEISFALQGPGKFFVVAIMENQPKIFANGQNQWFIGGPNNPVGDVTVRTIKQLTAKYHIFWTDGTNKAHLDPKVIVKPGGPSASGPQVKATRKAK